MKKCQSCLMTRCDCVVLGKLHVKNKRMKRGWARDERAGVRDAVGHMYRCTWVIMGTQLHTRAGRGALYFTRNIPNMRQAITQTTAAGFTSFDITTKLHHTFPIVTLFLPYYIIAGIPRACLMSLIKSTI